MNNLPVLLLVTLLFLGQSLHSQSELITSVDPVADSILEKRGEIILSLPLSEKKSWIGILPEWAPDKITDTSFCVYLDREDFNIIRKNGIKYNILQPPSLTFPVKMADDPQEVLEGRAYPTYSQYLQIMEKFRLEYPDLCTTDTIGYSIAGRLILSARLQKGKYSPGERPVVFLSSTMHGDETVGYSLLIMLISDILSHHESDARAMEILENLTLVINPLSNPDGAYFQSDTSIYGAKRFNLSNIDLNRNFPDVRNGMAYSSAGLEIENLAMLHYMEKFPPALSANLHTGAEVLNYPWDTWYREENIHADDEWFEEICKCYVDTARTTDPFYLRLYPEGYVFGSDWYWIPGGRQDFVTYCLRGRELTMELSDDKLPHASRLAGFWEKNHSALLNFILEANRGIMGTVTDSITGEKVQAEISRPGYDKNESQVYSHPNSGNFFRFLTPGTYLLEARAEGYRTKRIEVNVPESGKEFISLAMAPDTVILPEIADILFRTGPGQNQITLEIKGDPSETFTADLYTLTGRKVLEKIFLGKTGVLHWDNPGGVYILRVRTQIQKISRLVYF